MSLIFVKSLASYELTDPSAAYTLQSFEFISAIYKYATSIFTDEMVIRIIGRLPFSLLRIGWKFINFPPKTWCTINKMWANLNSNFFIFIDLLSKSYVWKQIECLLGSTASIKWLPILYFLITKVLKLNRGDKLWIIFEESQQAKIAWQIVAQHIYL